MTPRPQRPDPDALAGPDASAFRAVQWRMLLATMFGYLFFYTGRQNFGFVIKALQDDLGLSATAVGTISAGMLLCYGVGQAINGNLGDTYGARRMMSLGAVLSTALNWWTSLGQTFWGILAPWSLNGYVQSLGWAPGSRLISDWWAHHERGRAFGFYVFAAGFSSIVTFGLCILVLEWFDWRWVLRLPVLLMLVGGLVFYVVARDRPEDLGFPPVDRPNPSDEVSQESETAWQRYRYVLNHGRFLIACLSIGCESIARYGLLIWVPVHYLGEGWRENPGSAWITLALPVGMALGALTAGQISDRVFAANRSRPIGIFMTLAAVATLLILVVPSEWRLAGVFLLFLSGFLVYGPQSSYWALCPDLLGRQRAGTGVGVMNTFAYTCAAGGEILIGGMIDTSGRTDAVFPVVAVFCLLGAGLILFVRE